MPEYNKKENTTAIQKYKQNQQTKYHKYIYKQYKGIKYKINTNKRTKKNANDIYQITQMQHKKTNQIRNTQNCRNYIHRINTE